MTPELKTKLIKAVKEDRLYDFIANHYYEMDKEELKDVFLEVIYAIHESEIYITNVNAIQEQIIENIEDNIDVDE